MSLFKCIKCGCVNFKKAVIEICKECGESYSDEEASLVIARIMDGYKHLNTKKI